MIVFFSCKKSETAIDILTKTINTIDTIETIYYKQDMSRTNPRNTSETIKRYREIFITRLISDSIVGVKGHWYMYVNDKEKVTFEDIYDGDRLIRKNNRDSVAMIYDLVKYPDFKTKPFWGHNTLYGMQYEFKYFLKNLDSYTIDRLSDTIINEKNCFQIQVSLEDKISMPSFGARLEDKQGNISKTFYFIDKETYYPIRMRGESYSKDNSKQSFFIDQRYYNIKFNLIIDENIQFNTTEKSIVGFEKREMKPE
jgi:hypothetical protein